MNRLERWLLGKLVGCGNWAEGRLYKAMPRCDPLDTLTLEQLGFYHECLRELTAQDGQHMQFRRFGDWYRNATRTE